MFEHAFVSIIEYITWYDPPAKSRRKLRRQS